jgi:outer membrane receptor protein involved in Fe transport
LRNLGTDRTLVLVDGRRHVSSVEGSASVDINTIPEDLIERVDVLTGGASAIYGADGVSGVVNFVLKKNFEGLTGRVQAGISKYGDAGQRYATLTAGHNFGDGRGNGALLRIWRRGSSRRPPADQFEFHVVVLQPGL